MENKYKQWAKEIELVKSLGERIGYGNMMDIASSLWAINLEKKGYPVSGAFEPVCLDVMLEPDVLRMKHNRLLRTKLIKEIMQGKPLEPIDPKYLTQGGY